MKNSIFELKITDAEYPKILKEIPHPPKLLYYRGDLDALNKQPAIAVVGTRRCSEYGKETTKKIVSGLAKAGVCIVSGMARGIDSYAHKEAIENGALTVAVLGSPVDDEEIYPQSNVKLAHKIIESGGIVLSEYKKGEPGHPGQFPARNRIVAGLSGGTLVTEAPIKSGAMITARLALDSNRDVYAVPGTIFSYLSAGCNKLIASGAKCVMSPEDILEDLGLNYEISIDGLKNTDNLDEAELKILNVINKSPNAVHIDQLTRSVGLDTEKVSQAVTSLMLQDLIKESGANSYIAL
ncbi:MAG: DNA-processing protein DprA [Candidatus Spechtbacterales bacterium]